MADLSQLATGPPGDFMLPYFPRDPDATAGHSSDPGWWSPNPSPLCCANTWEVHNEGLSVHNPELMCTAQWDWATHGPVFEPGNMSGNVEAAWIQPPMAWHPDDSPQLCGDQYCQYWDLAQNDEIKEALMRLYQTEREHAKVLAAHQKLKAEWRWVHKMTTMAKEKSMPTWWTSYLREFIETKYPAVLELAGHHSEEQEPVRKQEEKARTEKDEATRPKAEKEATTLAEEQKLEVEAKQKAEEQESAEKAQETKDMQKAEETRSAKRRALRSKYYAIRRQPNALRNRR